MGNVSDVALRFAGLGYAYHPRRWVFRNYAADVGWGRVFAVLGPNGRGKSTLLHVLLDALRPVAGEVLVSERRAYVPQLFQTSFDYRVLDMVVIGRARQIGLFAQPSKSDRQSALEALERVGLRDAAERPFHELSGGERQLVILARALVANARSLIFDEPTSALDLHNQGLVLAWMDKLAHESGLAIVFSTHPPNTQPQSPTMCS
jgi:iron complex transport system ATP-binding protein